jgi:hypothetical protein
MKHKDKLILKNLTPIQKKYYNDTHRFSITSAGRRSRKTIISMAKLENRALDRSLIEKNCRYFHAAPVWGQAKKIFWDLLKKNTKMFWVKNPYETDLIVFLINGIEIHVTGLDKPSRIEGQPWHGGHITEMPNTKPKIWGEHIRPLFSDTNGFCFLDGVPEGKGDDYYDMVLHACGGAIPQTMPNGVGAYGENPQDPEWAFFTWLSADVLTEAEIISAKIGVDERTFRQEWEGSFESMEGRAYYNFSKENLKLCKYKEGQTVHIGMDFNVNPMTAVFGHIESDEYHQFGEAYLKNSNTFEMARHIAELFPIDKVTIYPDSTGNARESNAWKTDLQILRDYGYYIRAKSTNPYVRDRINAVNSLICSMGGKRRYFANPETCPKTINDLNRVERLPDGRENKKQEEQGLVHISSALGYLINFNFPVLKQEISTK